MYYKGYKVGTIEKELLKLILNVKDRELPSSYNETFSDILKTAKQKSEYSNITKRMAQKGFIKFVDKNRQLKFILTDKGKKIAQDIFLFDFKNLKKPKEWDGKWRLVMFDIPENKRKLRNIIRFHLKRIGFVQIQASVWIYPYSCQEIITIIKTNFGFNNEVIYITAGSFEKDSEFKKLFKL